MNLENCPESQLIQCEICQLSYQTKQGLKRHKLAVHDGKKPFKCDMCDRSFADKGNLKKLSNQTRT